jgi:hypothetical protein
MFTPGCHRWAQVFELLGGPKAPVPPARTGHSATVYQDKYLVVFGGEGGRRVPRGWGVVQEQENGWEWVRGGGLHGEEESGRAMGRVARRCIQLGLCNCSHARDVAETAGARSWAGWGRAVQVGWQPHLLCAHKVVGVCPRSCLRVCSGTAPDTLPEPHV